MRKWNALGGVLAVLIVASTGWGQSTEDLQRRLQDLEQRLVKVESENANLKNQMVDNDDQVLETQVNALLDRYAAGTTVNSAANPITMTGQFRMRNNWEFGDPGFNSRTNFAGLNNELNGSWTDALVRLGFMYEFTRDVTAMAELQAHWDFGDPGAATNGGNAVGPLNAGLGTGPYTAPFGGGTGEPGNTLFLYQGWVEVRNIFNRPEFSSKTGRQEIVLGNQYQFGNADWYSGFTFDATVWTWDDESFRLKGIVAKLASFEADQNQFPSYLSSHDDDELYSVYFTLKTIKNHELDLYWIFVNANNSAAAVAANGSLGTPVGSVGGSKHAHYHTIGGRIGGEFPDIAAGLDWNVEGAYQFGSASGNIDVDGWSIEAEAGLTFNKDNMFRVYGRFLFAEGPNGGDSGYIPLFPNRHSNSGFRARYGLFDVMPMFNVLSIQGGLSFDPDPAWTLGAGAIWATTDQNNATVGNKGGNGDYGWEIDAWGEYRYSEQLTMGAGVAFLFADDEGEALWNTTNDTQVLIYVQARLVF